MGGGSGLSRETLGLRLAGLILLVLSLGLFLAFEEMLDPARWFHAPSFGALARHIVALLIATNVLALGVALLLSGLRHLSLRSNPRARRGALVSILAVNLLLPCAVFAVLADDPHVSRLMETQPWVLAGAVALLAPFVYLARTSILLLRSSWKYGVASAEEVLRRDPRPPVVYLRSFGIDEELTATDAKGTLRLAWWLHYTHVASPEQELASIMNRVGPLVAIGKPGERLPELGAARLYVDDSRWRDVVGDLLSKATLVLIRAGDTPGLWWEIERAVAHQSRHRVVIVALGGPSEEFRRRFDAAFGAPLPLPERQPASSPVWSRMLASRASRASLGAIIFFDGSGQPREQPIVVPWGWSAWLQSIYSPYGAALHAAVEPVLASLGVQPPAAHRSVTAAVFLATFGGFLGLHHFYLRRRRLGVAYLLFFWTGVPLLLGVVDAVRLACMNERQFQAAAQAHGGEGLPGS